MDDAVGNGCHTANENDIDMCVREQGQNASDIHYCWTPLWLRVRASVLGLIAPHSALHLFREHQ